jgi:hypothetical protein
MRSRRWFAEPSPQAISNCTRRYCSVSAKTRVKERSDEKSSLIRRPLEARWPALFFFLFLFSFDWSLSAGWNACKLPRTARPLSPREENQTTAQIDSCSSSLLGSEHGPTCSRPKPNPRVRERERERERERRCKLKMGITNNTISHQGQPNLRVVV